MTLTCALLALAALMPQSDAPADTSATERLDDVLERLRSRTEQIMSAESRTLDTAYRDSISAAFDSTVVADGLAPTLDRNADRRGARRNRGRGDAVRTGFTVAPEDGGLDYTKVDGFSAATAAYAYVTTLGLRTRVGGRIGYAFGSKRERHDAGVELSAHGVHVGGSHREVTEPFGLTAVHGRRLFALAGSDEHDYLGRDGWRTHLEIPDLLPGSLATRLTYRKEHEIPRRARDTFTIGDPSRLFEQNVQATSGLVRALRISVGRPRLDYPDLYGTLIAELAGRGLGGDLSYDVVRFGGGYTRRLPWADDVAIAVAAQASVAPGGDVPVQVLADPSGRSGVRGYPHRSIAGSHALLLRVDYRMATDLFRAARIPLLRRAKLQLVPFADVGAAWSPTAARTLADSTVPGSDDWKWGAGLGIRRGVGAGEIISHVRLDAAFRLDRSGTSPVVYFVLENEPFD